MRRTEAPWRPVVVEIGIMRRLEILSALENVGRQPDEMIDLAEVALLLAALDRPDTDLGPYRRHLATLASNLADLAIGQSDGLDVRAAALTQVISEQHGYIGDRRTYDDLQNASLLGVIDRRKGLPVALGVFYIAAARRCKLDVCGVDFPAHFLLRVETPDGPVALDPFSHGRLVLPSELTSRALQAGLTPGVADRLEDLMAPVPDRAVAVRLENNIYARASVAGDYARAERSALRRALLDPKDHRPWIDVAAAREGQGALVGAQQALSMAQTLDGGAAIAARAARERVRLKLN
jgi:regulator of sirC expression with transglutaminase-like and TPR domain